MHVAGFRIGAARHLWAAHLGSSLVTATSSNHACHNRASYTPWNDIIQIHNTVVIKFCFARLILHGVRHYYWSDT